ncbi:MAG: hypothetical protein H6604_06150 [Flavobacteriales bacterium]|nr:hypothetical protein [Flavobacteriales bacterium]
MKFKAFVLLLFVLGFVGVSYSQMNYIYLQDLEQGKYLEKAQKTSVKKFFDRMVSNGFELESSPRKWKVVTETMNYIYYGIERIALNGEKIITNFSKVDAFEIKTLFPIYANTDGVHIKAKLYYLFIHDYEQQSIRPVCDKRYRITYDKYKMILDENGINVKMNVTGYCYDDKVLSMKIDCILDPTSLEVLEQHNQITDYINPENNENNDLKSKLKALF